MNDKKFLKRRGEHVVISDDTKGQNQAANVVDCWEFKVTVSRPDGLGGEFLWTIANMKI